MVLFLFDLLINRPIDLWTETVKWAKVILVKCGSMWLIKFWYRCWFVPNWCLHLVLHHLPFTATKLLTECGTSRNRALCTWKWGAKIFKSNCKLQYAICYNKNHIINMFNIFTLCTVAGWCDYLAMPDPSNVSVEIPLLKDSKEKVVQIASGRLFQSVIDFGKKECL